MKNEKKTNEKLDEVMQQLENGVKAVYTSEKYAEYLRFMGSFHDYSLNNCILIWHQCPGASLVAGFRAWQEKHNRHVVKGAKAIRILAPCPHKMNVEQVDPVTGEKVQKEVRWNTYRPVCVFDVSQTDGAPIPSLVNPLTGSMERFDELFARLQSISPVSIAFEKIEGSASGYFHTAEKRIAIREGLSQEQTIKTTVHEIAHAILHCENGEEADTVRHIKEVQAESVAYVVCNALGFDTSEYSFGYVAGWAEGRDAKDLTANLEVIKKTAADMIDALTAEGKKIPAAAPAKDSEPAKKAEKKPAKKGKQPKKAPKKDKALEKWTESAGKRFDKLSAKGDSCYQNTENGCFFVDYYHPYWAAFIPGFKAESVTQKRELDRAEKLCALTENHKPVTDALPGTLGTNHITRYTNSEGVQMWVNDKYRKYFPKAARAYVDKRIGTLVLTLGEGEHETVIGCILPINIPEDGGKWQPIEQAQAA